MNTLIVSIFVLFYCYIYILLDFCYFCCIIAQWKFRCYNKVYLSLLMLKKHPFKECSAVVAELFSFIFVYYLFKIKLLQDYI